ncbi:MAG: DUF5615 family PIN-like protein [Acidimicrobiia bacterium]
MRLLLDANLSPRLADLLIELGRHAIHVSSVDLHTAADGTILEYAESERLVLVTADTDFPMLVALRRASSPSVVLLRGVNQLPVEVHANILTSNLAAVDHDLQRGAIVTLSPQRMRVRHLPLR